MSNKKELEVGCLKTEVLKNYLGQIDEITFLYYSDCFNILLTNWKSQIEVEIISYYTNDEIKTVEIVDFISKEANKGYGTIILNQLCLYFSEIQDQPITVLGKLSIIDEVNQENTQRRNHVYQKLGFEIINNCVKKIINPQNNL